MTTVLPAPRRHLGADALEAAPVGGDLDARLLGGGRLAQPDQRFDRFDLAEEEAPGLEFLRVVPVLEQAPGDRGGAGPAGLAPRLDPRADAVDQGDFDEGAGVVEGAGVFGSDDVSGGAAARHEVEQAGCAVVAPVVRRLLVGRVDDEPVDGGLRHHSGSGGTSGSSWAISLIASISASFMTSGFDHSTGAATAWPQQDDRERSGGRCAWVLRCRRRGRGIGRRPHEPGR